jgi:hypothetical protein
MTPWWITIRLFLNVWAGKAPALTNLHVDVASGDSEVMHVAIHHDSNVPYHQNGFAPQIFFTFFVSLIITILIERPKSEQCATCATSFAKASIPHQKPHSVM